ncbi:MAG: TonB-dependent receptor [Chitinophagales bacterium]|nr:TonB-dependent receptor [Chitinophagales bacterium]
MQKLYKFLIFSCFCSLFALQQADAQVVLKGKVLDAETGEALIGAAVAVGIDGKDGGAITDYDGNFTVKAPALPTTLRVSYTGYATQEVPVSSASDRLSIKLAVASTILEEAVVRGQRIDDKQKAAPLTVEKLDNIAIKEAPSFSFYNSLGNLKGVDLTTASLGFTIINTRGFNSTSPVRSLQIIDGVDNQAPGLNFSLGNFLGASDLDVNGVDLIVGASSSFYGPNAFNGVISMETKNPFLHRGLAASVKVGERALTETAFRWADAWKNKDGHYQSALKFNFFYLRANDWEAENDNPVDGTDSGLSNPGGWDKVNTYGDEYFSLNDLSDRSNLSQSTAGLGLFHRQGYREVDLVDYNTRNLKMGAAYHLRTKPALEYDSPELIIASNFGTGTTVYQGDNRFSLRGIRFFQNRIEFRKKDKYFIRAYATNEDAGRSFDPYFTALRLQESAKSNENWALNYIKYWQNEIFLDRMKPQGYPQNVIFLPEPPFVVFDEQSSLNWLAANQDSLTYWHTLAAAAANLIDPQNATTTQDFFAPGTERFQQEFDRITGLKSTEGGTRFYDKSALYHAHGEYKFTPKFIDQWVVGGNARLYTPRSEGTIFKDSNDIQITNFEYGLYTGVEEKFANEKLIAKASLRMDKNQNFKHLFTPAASLVWKPTQYDYLRVSFSSAIRNPTLTDQYLNLNVGRATLLGNLDGFDSLITVESFRSFLDTRSLDSLQYFNAPPIQPEKVRTFEVGYRTTLFDRLYLDASYYYSFYNNFIGYNIGVYSEFDPVTLFPRNTRAYRVSANSSNEVTTQGFSIGANFYFADYYMLAGNYSWNKLNKTFADDPIIPAFNTPEHKYNISISGRDVPVNLGFARLKKVGFNLNYKWVEGFVFEGSPQFTGSIPSYALLDGQVNARFDKIHTVVKIGASNILNNKIAQTYGGPRIGRMAYVALVYDFIEK